MTCKPCGGTGWIIGAMGARQCKCRLERISKAEIGTPATPAAIAQAVQALGETLAFFPKGDAARMLIGDSIAGMCSTVEQLRHMVRRAVSLYTAWDKCGVPGLRQIVCSAGKPADGLMLSFTDAFPEGVPAEKPQQQPAVLSLPPGASQSAAPSIELSVADLARAKSIQNAGLKVDIHAIPVSRGPAITAADVERAAKEYREKKLNAAAKQEMVDV